MRHSDEVREPERRQFRGTFADDSEISSWAREAVYACRDAGLISGVGENRFDPQGYTERAAACKVFANYYERY